MNKHILNTVIQEFINNNINSNTAALLLKKTSFKNVELKEIAEQIEAKKRCKAKLPTWFNTPNIYYPNKLNIEQTSSEITAGYKSKLMSGNSIIDLTGGFGIDCFYFSKSFKEVIHCEIDEKLSKIVSYNFKQFGIDNVKAVNTDGIEHLKSSKQNYDWIYVDPSRRHDSKGKVFYLKDCLPNIPKHLDLLFEHTDNVLIKASPMLDLSIGITELKQTKAIHIVAVNNDVKELLFVLCKGYSGEIKINTINTKGDKNEAFEFAYSSEINAKANYSLPLTYLYEPNAAILKSGGFKTIAEKLDICKLHRHSHLYTSKVLINFPGRVFKITEELLYNKKNIKRILSNTKANITVRNFPESVSFLRKKFNIKDGGDTYVFFTTNANDEKVVVICEKV
ncbi:class I SAM-dependent methyltransferase [Flavobacteriaceae bacterium S0825]|uniref:class I SAM-dependent methyltransferase n=1 Tax=Gaetbulibacter sp. S0825 TaxID=2720084 RepID=UPI001430CB7E|nr:class I SAM-dependent methyltransferase [Gaetbulibacter sp. S0825]MCK0109835.1 class I SAM-dependent methyltransferase [Flavobacteriaceae bacterium S0825]NIX65464.1 class I SAM-dependent methyltransferase [Gaetbulibacter sp. S0825]